MSEALTVTQLDEPEPQVYEIDGYLVDESGEIVGHAAAPEEQFHVTDVQSAEWVLGKLVEAEAAIELAHVMETVYNRFTPHVPLKVEACVSRYWSKAAEPVWANGRLIPWEGK